MQMNKWIRKFYAVWIVIAVMVSCCGCAKILPNSEPPIKSYEPTSEGEDEEQSD